MRSLAQHRRGIVFCCNITDFFICMPGVSAVDQIALEQYISQSVRKLHKLIYVIGEYWDIDMKFLSGATRATI